MCGRIVLRFFFIACVSLPGIVWSADDPLLVQVLQLMDDAEYKKAERLIAARLPRAKLAPTLRARLYWLQGVCLISLNDAKAAQTAFLKLLALEPAFEPDPLTSPKIQQVYRDTQNLFKRGGTFDNIYQPLLVPIENVSEGDSSIVQFSIGNKERALDVARVQLHFRRFGTADFMSVDLARTNDKTRWIGMLPKEVVFASHDNTIFEYYVEALSAFDKQLVLIGNPETPLSFTVISTTIQLQNKPVAATSSRWPYWVLAGAGILTGIIVGILLLKEPDEGAFHVTVHQ